MSTRPTAASLSSPRRIASNINGYYRLHARIYDATRWTFLFGRDAIIALAAATTPEPSHILEVGCGTGRNLAALARRFPRAQITGLDLSEEMLSIARRKTGGFADRITLLQRTYDAPVDAARGHDLVLCSYALTMFNPGFEDAIAVAARDLKPAGHFALIDFHATRYPWFSRWMGINHVRMDGQLRPVLRATFAPVSDELRSAYGGIWNYLLFVGRRKAPSKHPASTAHGTS